MLNCIDRALVGRYLKDLRISDIEAGSFDELHQLKSLSVKLQAKVHTSTVLFPG